MVGLFLTENQSRSGGDIMEENKNIINNEENNYDTIIIEDTDEVTYDEIVQVVQVDEPELFVVDTDNAFTSLGEANEQLNHNLLHNRDVANQHIIESITGLREELDGIHALKTVESDKRGYANYYMWKDQSGLPTNRVGYFVSIHTRDHKISRCDANTEIFGVTVGSAGFVGWQQYDEEDKPRDEEYALVANTGVVKVRCESDVVVGDYVMSDNRGKAKKTTNGHGYYVISIDNSDGDRYAVISLDSTMNQVYDLSQEVDKFNERVANVEIATNAAINTARDALKNSFEAGLNSALKNSQDALDSANSALGRVEELSGLVDDMTAISGRVDVIEGKMVLDIPKAAQDAVDQLIDDAIETNQDIEAIRSQIGTIQQTAIESRDAVRDLISQVDPIIQLGTEDALGAAYLVASTEDNAVQLAAISQCLSNDYETIDTWNTDFEEYTGKIFYAKDTGLYHYFDTETESWATTSEPSEAGLSEAIASIRQKTDKDQAMVESLTSYSGEQYETVAEWNGYQKVYTWSQNIADPYITYYEETTGLYWQCDINNLDTPWSSSSTPPRGDLEEKDITKVYYAEDTGRYYCYYDNGWHSTDSSTAKLAQTIAITRQIANNNSAKIEDILKYEGPDGDSLTAIISSVEANRADIDMLTSYVQKNYTKLNEPWDSTGKDTEIIYYAQDPADNVWKYWYYKDDVVSPNWFSSVDPSDARLTASLADINQTVTDQGANIKLLTEWSSDTDDAIARLEQSVSDDGALMESLVMNISKYTVGKYSQAYGLTIEEAKELLRDGTIFVPTEEEGTTEYYHNYVTLDDVWSADKESIRNQELMYYAQISKDSWKFWSWDTSTKKWVTTDPDDITTKKDFSKNFYYVWDKDDGIWRDGGNVTFTSYYIRGSEATEYIVVEYGAGQNSFAYESVASKSEVTGNGLYYIEDELLYYYFQNGTPYLAQDPHFENGALYYWKTEDDKSYWQKVATVESNTLNRAISQMRQSVTDNSNAFEINLTNTKGDLASISAEVDGMKSSIESVTTFDNRLTTIEQESTANTATLSMLAMTGVEGLTVWDSSNPPKETSKVYYDKTNKKYYYYNGNGWTGTTDVNDSNVTSKIHSAGIITAINNDTSGVKISGDMVNITADNINLEGVVTVASLKKGGTTEIDGERITTGIIKSKNYRPDNGGSGNGCVIDYRVEEVYDASQTYYECLRFVYDEASGYYISQNGKNAGVDLDYSLAIGKIVFNAIRKDDVKFEARSYAEFNYDYGIFCKINTDISIPSQDFTSNPSLPDSTKIQENFKANNSSTFTTITYSADEVNVGENYIYVLYFKDQSNSNNNDCLEFRMSEESIGSGQTGTLINLEDGSIDTKNFKVDSEGNLTIKNIQASESITVGGVTTTDLDTILGTLATEVNSSIESVDVEYAQNSSSQTAPTSGWSTNAPTWTDGKYIWTRTKTVSGGTTSYSNPVCITGAKGATGATGKDGATGSAGADGQSVTDIEEEYYLSTSSTTQSGGSWSTAQPTWKANYYIWTRSKITWENPEATTYTTPVLAKAINGANSTANSAQSVANTNKDLLDAWSAQENGVTVIKGAKIATGSIGAVQVAAGSITVDKLSVGLGSTNYASTNDWSGDTTNLSFSFDSNNSYKPRISMISADTSSEKRLKLNKSFYVTAGSKLYCSAIAYAAGTSNASNTYVGIGLSYSSSLNGTYALNNYTSSHNLALKKEHKIGFDITVNQSGYYRIEVWFNCCNTSAYLKDIFVAQGVPGEIVVNGKISSVDGKTYFDLDNSIIKTVSSNYQTEMSGGSLKFNNSTDVIYGGLQIGKISDTDSDVKVNTWYYTDQSEGIAIGKKQLGDLIVPMFSVDDTGVTFGITGNTTFFSPEVTFSGLIAFKNNVDCYGKFTVDTVVLKNNGGIKGQYTSGETTYERLIGMVNENDVVVLGYHSPKVAFNTDSTERAYINKTEFCLKGSTNKIQITPTNNTGISETSSRYIVGDFSKSGGKIVRRLRLSPYHSDGSYGVSIDDDTNAGTVWFRPTADNYLTLGSASYKWKDIYAYTSSIDTSDKTMKRDIQNIESNYEEIFYSLKPVSFKFIDGKRTHLGFIAQDVEEAMINAGLTPNDFAALCKDPIDDNGNEMLCTEENYQNAANILYGLRYSEFIPLCVHMIQKLQNKVNELEEKLNERTT